MRVEGNTLSRGLQVLDTATGQRLAVFGPSRYTRAVALHRSGLILAQHAAPVETSAVAWYTPDGVELWDEGESNGAPCIVAYERRVLPWDVWRLPAPGPSGHGDMDCDGSFNGFDIEAFVTALTDPDTFKRRWPDCDIRRADVSHDGTVNASDIQVFAETLRYAE